MNEETCMAKARGAVSRKVLVILCVADGNGREGPLCEFTANSHTYTTRHLEASQIFSIHDGENKNENDKPESEKNNSQHQELSPTSVPQHER
jgi:hypothetical protein